MFQLPSANYGNLQGGRGKTGRLIRGLRKRIYGEESGTRKLDIEN